MPLKLSLRPSEAIIVNGAVMRNGDRRGVMVVENRAKILREKDVVFPEAIQSLAEHAYFAIMQIYLTSETEGELYIDATSALADLAATSADDILKQRALDISILLADARVYEALSKCRKLMKAAGGQNA
ncbi:MAG: flagellar biosynthesis repressor FlbT [Pseudomonadota bacterium]